MPERSYTNMKGKNKTTNRKMAKITKINNTQC